MSIRPLPWTSRSRVKIFPCSRDRAGRKRGLRVSKMVGCQGVPVPLAPRRVARADEPLEPEGPEPRREVAREAAPLRVVAGQEDGFVAEGVHVVVEVGVHLRLDVVVLRVELIVLGRPRGR